MLRLANLVDVSVEREARQARSGAAHRWRRTKKTGIGRPIPDQDAGGKPATGRLCRTGPRLYRRGSGASPTVPHRCDKVRTKEVRKRSRRLEFLVWRQVAISLPARAARRPALAP